MDPPQKVSMFTTFFLFFKFGWMSTPIWKMSFRNRVFRPNSGFPFFWAYILLICEFICLFMDFWFYFVLYIYFVEMRIENDKISTKIISKSLDINSISINNMKWKFGNMYQIYSENIKHFWNPINFSILEEGNHLTLNSRW